MPEPTRPIVVAVNISPGGIPKRPLLVGTVTHDGIVGDGHDHEKHITPNQALCLFDIEDLEDLCTEHGYDLFPGAVGENITLRGMQVDSLAIGDQLAFSGGVVAEISKLRTPCFVLDQIDPELKVHMRGRSGFYAKIITEGAIRPGETVAVHRANGARAR